MGEDKKNNNKNVESALSLIAIVGSFMYIYDTLTAKHLLDVLIAVVIFGLALSYLSRQLE